MCWTFGQGLFGRLHAHVFHSAVFGQPWVVSRPSLDLSYAGITQDSGGCRFCQGKGVLAMLGGMGHLGGPWVDRVAGGASSVVLPVHLAGRRPG